MNPLKTNSTIVAINLKNSEFWEVQRVLMKKRFTNDFIVGNALKTMNSNCENLLPTYWKKSLEVALADAEENHNASMKYFAQKGGKAVKEDALQKYIITCVQLNSKITDSQLLDKLMNQMDHDFINDMEDGVISFNNGNGKIKNASIAGLKDRLSRAKKKVSSR